MRFKKKKNYLEKKGVGGEKDYEWLRGIRKIEVSKGEDMRNMGINSLQIDQYFDLKK